MYITSLSLQHFRNYSKASFVFDPRVTVIVGTNAAGKTSLIEAISFLATGKSFKSEKEGQVIQFGQQFARLSGSLHEIDDEATDTVEVVFAFRSPTYVQKKYLVNAIARRRADFAGRLPIVLFTPEDLTIVSGQPSTRRNFLNDILEQTDDGYRIAFATYTKALKQRNALLSDVRETGSRDEQRFAYWDELLIKTGSIIIQRREELIANINSREKELFSFVLEYDKSTISAERLAKYQQAEIGSGVTLVGPHRDDVFIKTKQTTSKSLEEVKYFSSRGQQRLVTLELKLAQIALLREALQKDPLLLLDDIFSELDGPHISHVLQMMDRCQTVITTTHKEFIEGIGEQSRKMIELEKI